MFPCLIQWPSFLFGSFASAENGGDILTTPDAMRCDYFNENLQTNDVKKDKTSGEGIRKRE